jgi:hypothetical protein
VPLVAVTAAYVALFVYYLQANIIRQPYWDMYSYILRYLQYREDGALWAYLWEPHVQHRQVWMRLLTAFDIELFAGIAYPFIVFAAACQLAAAWVLWRAVRAGVPRDQGTMLGCLVVMLVLTSVAAVDCAIPMNGIYPQAVLFVVLAFVLFDAEALTSGTQGRRVPWRRAAALCAAMASALANAAALVVWPILVWLAWRTRAGRGWTAAVIAAGGVFTAAYLYRLPGAALGDASSPAAGPADPDTLRRMADYLVTYMGLPWTRSGARDCAAREDAGRRLLRGRRSGRARVRRGAAGQ